jgi:hypothetical protein
MIGHSCPAPRAILYAVTLRVRIPVATVVALGLVAFPLATDAAGSRRARQQIVGNEDAGSTKFSNPTRIDNRWSPFTPGTELVLDGEVVADGVPTPHRVVLVVTDVTKVIDGVRALVVWDVDFQGGEIAENELTFVAQDDDGNVWTMGEYPEEYENGQFSGAPNAWLSGRHNARAGLLLQANPQPGTNSYVQGYSPDIEFLDEAIVTSTKQQVCVPVSCYQDVVGTDEWSPLDPQGGHQLKQYAPGVGTVRIAASGGVSQETLELTKIEKIGSDFMTFATAKVLELDRRAYSNAKAVYAGTPRATSAALPPSL